jgi:hypothetical protein
VKLELNGKYDASVIYDTGSMKCISVAMNTGFLKTIECIRWLTTSSKSVGGTNPHRMHQLKKTGSVGSH